MLRSISVFIAILIFITSNAQKRFSISSPNNNITTEVKIKSDGIYYNVSFKKKLLIADSKLSLAFDQQQLLQGINTARPKIRDTTETYTLQTGKASLVTTHYRELSIPLQQKNIKLNLLFRVFDDGVAFRYEFVSGNPKDTMTLTEERADFNLQGNPVAKVLILPNFTSSHEGSYTTTPIEQLPGDKLMDMPALFQFSNNSFLAITEAALLDYAGMYLIKRNGVLQSELSPLPRDKTIKAKFGFPHVSPWRVMLISDKAGDLISSAMLTSLSPASRIGNADWIRPGTTTFPWWNGNVTPDTLNAPGNNFVTQQYYIDFCASNHITYHTVVEYGLHQWYTDDGVGFQPGPNADVTKPVPGLDMKKVCDYAHSKGVGVRVWVHWAALYPKLDSAFAIFERWGLSGMMIDFMDRDDQEMVNIQTEMLEKAAKHHLHIQFHGAYKPTGTSRTYPNELTREGTLNYEVNKWGPALTPGHDLDIAFTRLIAGSTDYHLGGFRAVTTDNYRAQYTRPLMLGTRCHMLAMYIVLENALGMVCDYPAAYEGEEGFEFIKNVPTTWDETKVLDALPGEYIVIARRKNNDWYIGAINNGVKRTLPVKLDFVNNNASAIIFSDDNISHDSPNKLQKRVKTIKKDEQLNIELAANGGFAIILSVAK